MRGIRVWTGPGLDGKTSGEKKKGGHGGVSYQTSKQVRKPLRNRAPEEEKTDFRTSLRCTPVKASR